MTNWIWRGAVLLWAAFFAIVGLRGVIDPATFQFLQADDYQREILQLSRIDELAEAAKRNSLPDIELGMRGGDFRTYGDKITLNSDVYIIDGLQRVTACMHLMQKVHGAQPRLGALVHFNTTKDWERERFRILNMERTKLSPNVLLRNFRPDFSVVDLLYNLTENKDFILHGKVCWMQRMRRHELISALTLLKVVGRLHSHVGPGKSNSLRDLAGGIQKIMEKVGKGVFRDNVRSFFDLVDESWGIRRVAFKEGAVYMRSSFLMCLAEMLSNHFDFWRGEDENRLFVEAPLVRKIKLFPVADPQVSNLASAGGKAYQLLYALMVSHINSGKRSKRLKSRRTDVEVMDLPGNTEEDGEDERQLAASGSN